jgi:hypothetical protein
VAFETSREERLETAEVAEVMSGHVLDEDTRALPVIAHPNVGQEPSAMLAAPVALASGFTLAAKGTAQRDRGAPCTPLELLLSEKKERLGVDQDCEMATHVFDVTAEVTGWLLDVKLNEPLGLFGRSFPQSQLLPGHSG